MRDLNGGQAPQNPLPGLGTDQLRGGAVATLGRAEETLPAATRRGGRLPPWA